ncbi:MAG: nuclear transport factor 2 family protein [Actinomycetota bacterium]
MILAPGLALAGTDRATDEDQMIAAARKTQSAIIAAYNEKRWDDLPPLYVEDAIMLPPNHEPIRGRDAIIKFLASARDAFGEADSSGSKSARVRASGNLVNFVYEFTAQGGRLRMMSHELYERQPDGTMLISIDEPSFIEPERTTSPGVTAMTPEAGGHGADRATKGARTGAQRE